MGYNALFIGSFLSSAKGSLSVSEFVAKNLTAEGYKIQTSSNKRNKIIRLIDIISAIVFTKTRIVQVEVYSGSAFRIAQISAIVAKIFGKKILFNLHGGMLPEFYKENRDLVINTLQRADKLISPSFYLKEFFATKGLEVEYLPNSVNLDHFPFKPGVENSTQKLLWVRSFSEIYNPGLAIEIIKILKKKYPSISLTMVGPNDGLLEQIQTIIKANNLEDDIHITGPIPNAELFKFYTTHQVYINTTSFESFGVSLVEAASCGIPIVTSSVGEIPKMWKDETEVLLVPNLDVQIFANQIDRILADQVLSEKLIVNARAKAIQYDWKNVKVHWHKLLNEYERKN
jgi:glycosyltransferase involved in cell wall biosynthesis